VWGWLWGWLWRHAGSFHQDPSGIALYIAVYVVGAVLVPTVVFAFRAIVQSKPLDKKAHEAWKSRRDFLIELAVLVLILFEAFVGLLSLHLEKDESAVQNTSADTLNDRMGQTVTELQKARVAMENQLGLIKKEYDRQEQERGKKPILSLVTKGRINATPRIPGTDWYFLGDAVYLEDYTEEMICKNQPLQSRRVLLGVRNIGDLNATDGYLRFIVPYGFQITCPKCTFLSQDVQLPLPGTEVTAPFEVSLGDIVEIPLTFSRGNDTDPLLLTQMEMKTGQTGLKHLKPLKILICRPQTNR
jgi:hypothetical protein